MSAKTKTNAVSSSVRAEQEQQLLRNVATTNEQPPNKFALNSKSNSGKTPPVANTHGNEVNDEQDAAKDLRKQNAQPQTMTSTYSKQQLEDFAKKKQERDQEILEIQEMLNKMKSPQKTSARSSKESPIASKEEEEDGAQEQVTSSKIVPETAEPVKTGEKENHFYGRCKTGLEFSAKTLDSANSRLARRDTARTSSTTAAATKSRSKSSQWPPSAKETKLNKKLNYNPEEARRYMEMQRKQRKENLAKDPTVRSKIEKEEIKKRLEELKKNTRKLAFKSVQKREQLLNKHLANKEMQTTKKLAEPERQILEARTKLQQKQREQQQNFVENSKANTTEEFGNEIKIPALETTQGISYRSTQSLNNVLRPTTNPLAENHKRIGLLRKTVNDKGFSLASHRNYNFDKENQNLEMLTKQLVQPVDNNKNNKDAHNLANRKDKQNNDSATKAKETLETKKTEYELTENNLNAKDKRTENEEPRTNELPYWLRPSTTQVYPYNFIMAVRKKLESIAEPVVARKTEETKRNQETSTTGLNEELKSHKRKSLDDLEHKQNKKIKSKQEMLANSSKNETEVGSNVAKRKPIQLKPLTPDKDANSKSTIKYLTTKDCPTTRPAQPSGSLKSLQSLSSEQENSKEMSKHFKSLESLNSEITSNFSSMSLPIPISNTLTEVSSLRTESRRTYTHSKNQPFPHSEDDFGSLSSQAFSSPEKNVNQLQKDFEFVKPRPVSPLSMEKVDKLKVKRKETSPQPSSSKKNDKEMDFSQLLEDFNRSLSQVIQVNEQLKSSLDKSQHILSPAAAAASAKKSSESDKYSSDFEKTLSVVKSGRANDELQQTLQNSNKNLQVRKRQLFEIAEKMQSPGSEQQKEDTQIKTESPHFKLSLKSGTQTSNTTSANEHNSSDLHPEDVEEDSSSSKALPTYETRLNEIEKLNATLRQTILQSKKKRTEQLQQQESESSKNKNNTEASDTTAKSSIRSREMSSAPATPAKGNSSDLTKSKSLKEISKHSNKSKQLENLFPAVSHDTKTQLEFDRKQHSLNAATDQTAEKLHELRDYTKAHTNSLSSQRCSTKSSSQQILPDTARISSHATTDNHSEADSSTSYTRVSSRSLRKSLKSQDAALSSSIAEEIQKTYEFHSYENENLPFNSNTNRNSASRTNLNEQADFIKSHINRSRGDFQETISEKSQFNESQFQQACEAASLISSTEFAQSADDEITSSVASKMHLNPARLKSGGNMHSTAFLSTYSTSKTHERVSSIGSEIVKIFRDNTRSETGIAANDSLSESSFNYSNVGLYDKLIQNETNKSQHLTALLKMREKALLDRTKGQIAWLEVQKARYKAKGLINHIAAIKKKQRGIILKMEKEREDIKRLLHTTTTTTTSKTVPTTVLQTAGGHKSNSQHNSPIKHKRERLPAPTTPLLAKPRSVSQHLAGREKHSQSISPILRATYELESSRAVEDLLRRREEDLRKRREHVERLMQWHQRLDEEEAEVLNLERQLLTYNNAPYLLEQQQSKSSTAATSACKEKLTAAGKAVSSATLYDQVDNVSTTKKKCASRARKMEKRLKEIDKSLKELSQISASSTTSGVMGQTNNEKEDSVSSAANQEIEFVRTSGSKLNKLWKRLTSQQIEKFEPTRRYKLCKSDLERLYEEAKMAVLRDFAEDEERIAKELLEKSASNLSSAVGHLDMPASACDNNIIEVPLLHLNLSTGPSEAEEESANNSQHNATQQGNYSPSVAEENFKAQALLNSSASSETLSEQQTPPADDTQHTRLLENNVQMFLALSQRIQASASHQLSVSALHNQLAAAAGDRKLQRSLSDTEISEVSSKYKAEKSTTSQNTIETITSHSKHSSLPTAGSFGASAQHHQRSKSSIVEMTYIPSAQQTATPSNYSDHFSQTPTQPTDTYEQPKPPNEARKAFDKESIQQTTNSRSSVICSVGAVAPLRSSQETSSDVASITEDVSSSNSSKPNDKSNLASFSGQVGGTSCETTAKEISNKLDEITAAVAQLSQMNALPSYESVAHAHLRNKSTEESNEETNLSADASSSYSFNFENITTDKHSSPGSAASLNATSIPHTATTLASKTYTKENDESRESTSSATTLHTQTGTSDSVNSKTFSLSDEAKTATSTEALNQSMIENRILDAYENDFESDLSNVTHIEDITQPIFETTVDTTLDNENENDGVETSSSSKSKEQDSKDALENLSAKISDKTYNADELKHSLSLPSSDRGKSFAQMDFKSPTPSSDRELLPPPPPPPPPPSHISPAASAASATITHQTGSNNHLMPDIINELELRRHQLILDNEHLKQYEHVTAVPYMYVREIPNKPPPPYVPPAHGSPMTTIFPSEDRIKDITFRRTHELYCELLKTEYCNEKGEKLPSVMEEQITNIYERIILDICREYLEEHNEILRDGDPTNFHSQLAFFNPPNRLRCIQDAIYKEVRTCLAMDKTQPKRTQIYSVYGQRAKQDHIGKIIIQEMYDEDDRWCNFHREESEVLQLMVEEMISKNIIAIAREVLVEEGGTIEEEVELKDSMMEASAVVNHRAEETSHFEDATGPEQGQEENEQETESKRQFETSSILMTTVNEDNQTYCVNEASAQYSVLNQTASIEHTELLENVSTALNSNLTTSSSAVQTCT